MEMIEYRVRPVTRYIITRYEEDGDGSAGSECLGEHDNHDVAFEVAYALCKAEHERLQWPIGDERIRYPQRIEITTSPPKPVEVEITTAV